MTKDNQDEFLAEITKAVEKSIETVVNGKIRRLDEKLSLYIERDELWKKDADPYIKLASHIAGTWKFSVYVIGGILSILALIKIT